MRRLKKHQASINKILKLDPGQLSGNRRLLAEMLAIWLDSDGTDREFIQSVIGATFGSAQRVRWNDPEDPPSKPDQSNANKDHSASLKEALALLNGGGKGDAVQSTKN